MTRQILENQSSAYQICGFTVLKPSRKNKSFKHWFNERATIYSYWELLIVGMAFIFTKLVNMLLGKDSPYSNKSLFRKNGVTEIECDDINSTAYISMVRALAPDVIVSISCPQLFQEELLGSATKVCLNAHGTLLPRHRGVFGSFWTLYCEDAVAGGTIHTMELRLDAGEIVWQEEFPVSKDDTQYSIAYKTKKSMANGLIQLFNQLAAGNELREIPQKHETSYHRAPSKEQGTELRAKGRRILKLSNLGLMLSNKY